MIYSDAPWGGGCLHINAPRKLRRHARRLTHPLSPDVSPLHHPTPAVSVHLHLQCSTSQPKGGPRLPFEQATMGVTGGVKGLFKALETELPR
jgi:hypothetical protein